MIRVGGFAATVGAAGFAATVGAAADRIVFNELSSWVNELTFIYSITANVPKATTATNTNKFFRGIVEWN